MKEIQEALAKLMDSGWTTEALAAELDETPEIVQGWLDGDVVPTQPKMVLAALEELLNKASAQQEPPDEKKQARADDESMGYVDSTWLRGGRYDIDPGFHEPQR